MLSALTVFHYFHWYYFLLSLINDVKFFGFIQVVCFGLGCASLKVTIEVRLKVSCLLACWHAGHQWMISA